MRYLTIQRNKSFIGCLMRLKIYIEDHTSNEIKIHGVPCRKIGTIKNGEQQTFMIGDEKLRIYVIADKFSKNYCSDFYEVPEGTENIFISGSCKYNPLNGNAFRFDGIPTEEMKYHRKKANRRGILVGLIVFIIFFAIGFAAAFLPMMETPEEKVFTKGNMSITLNEGFVDEVYGYSGFEAVYDTNDMAVFVIKEKFDGYAITEDMTVTEYCDAVIKANGQSAKTQQKDGLTYYEYTGDSDQGYKLHCTAFTYKADDGFYLVQFAVRDDQYSKYENEIFTYAKSVSIKQNSYT
ncbi:MAG: hypothetical protein J1F24_06690 [Oscillospiraceae bacterium]|nr:hypothetical protein [Oscillospiraceae bacterium]